MTYLLRERLDCLSNIGTVLLEAKVWDSCDLVGCSLIFYSISLHFVTRQGLDSIVIARTIVCEGEIFLQCVTVNFSFYISALLTLLSHKPKEEDF